MSVRWTLWILLSATSAWAVDAANCTQSAVSTAINATARGGTVNVPAGSFATCGTWTGLTITKGITLTGAGIDVTNVRGSGLLITFSPDSTAIANEENIKVSGFTFDGNNASTVMFQINGAGASGTKPWKYLIFTGNKIQNGATTGEAIHGTGHYDGVIASNTFDRVQMILRPWGNDDTTEWSNTAYNNFSFGSQDNLYFESNTIQWSSSFAGGGNAGWFESGQGGRWVVRFNTWNMANSGGGPSVAQEWWDVHGFQNWNGSPNSGQTGTMVSEFYDNTVTTPFHGYRWINHRGSWGMFFDNTYTGIDNPVVEINQYASGDAGGSGCSAQISPTPSNYTPEVNNTYVFNNIANGTRINMTQGSIGNGCGVSENNYPLGYWNQQTSFTGTVGMGRGTLASRPATCTQGVGYWATDQGEWNSSHAGVDGQFYKCTSTNTWSLYYIPLSYPHPLVAPPTFSISGTVSGFSVSGVVMTLGGAASASTTTDGSGNYSFSGLANGSYTVTPSKAGVVYTPSVQNVTVSSANVTGVNFSAASGSTFSISGTVTGAVQNNVQMALTGAATQSTTTNSSGVYSFTGLANGSYTVTPSLSGFTFSPTSTNTTISGANVTGINFTSSAVTYSISGTVTGPSPTSVTITRTGTSSGNTTTDGSGNYTFTGLSAGTYTIIPSKTGYVFTVSPAQITITTSNVTGVNFSQSPAPPTNLQVVVN